jgi:hypothetical protein
MGMGLMRNVWREIGTIFDFKYLSRRFIASFAQGA